MSRLFAVICLTMLLVSCSDRGLSSGEGFIDVPGGRVWYQVVGYGHKTPLLLVHGGPGWPSSYLAPLRRVAADRPVVFYDQLGAGNSDRNLDRSLWRMNRFVEELATVRRALGLTEVHILGHGWGSMLAVEYMQTNPVGVQSLVLASPVLSAGRWAEDAGKLIARLSPETQRAIATHTAARTTNDAEYQAAMQEYYRHYLSRSDPWSTHLMDAFGKRNSSLHTFMWGPSEFAITGTLENYDREDFLSQLDVPVLFTAGRHDEATPETVQYFHSLVPDSRIAIFENSAHMTMLDEPDAYADAVRRFLDEVDAL
jgi:proline iminopeptidase